MSESPVIGKIRKVSGIAGQYQLNAEVTYPGEPTAIYGFVGSTYGGNVIAISPSGAQMRVVTEVMDRCGSMLTESWVRAFFA